MEKVQISAMVKKETKHKLRCIAKREQRTMSGQIDYLIRRFIALYEKENGVIDNTIG